MYFTTQYITNILAILALVGHVAIVLFFLILIAQKLSRREFKWLNKSLKQVSRQALNFSLLITVAAVGGSMYFSEFAGYEPCLYCWWQRIFIYPIPILLLIGMIKKDRQITDYTLPFAGIALLIGIYHYATQLIALKDKELAQALVACETGGCTDFYFLKFGYITMPMMSITSTLLVIILLLLHRKYQR